MSSLVDVETGEEIADGFRPRKIRPAGWLEAAIADGSVRDPNAPEPEPRPRKPGDIVLDVPVATLSGRGD